MLRLRLAVILIGVASILCLPSCHDALGFGTKKVAQGYTLVLSTDENNVYALVAPRNGLGSDVSDIGWRKPYILSRSDSEHRWDVIDTLSAETFTVSEAERTSDGRFRDIPVYTAAVAWDRLRYRKPQW